MIHDLCNEGHEQVSTFHKIAILKTAYLSQFNHLSSDSDITDIISNIPDSAEAMIYQLLPENINVSPRSRTTSSGTSWRITTNHLLTPLDKALKTLLDTYNNTEVVILLYKYNDTYLYGNTQTPLVFSYSELHGNAGNSPKGYTINISGDTLEGSKIFKDLELNIFNRGLAFELAGSL